MERIPLLFDFVDIPLRSESTPFFNQNQSHGDNQHHSGQAGKLHGVHGKAEYIHGGIPGDGTDESTGNHAEEREQVTAQGIEGNMGGGFLLRQVHIQNVGISKVDPNTHGILDQSSRNPDPGDLWCHERHGDLGWGKEQNGDSEGFDPGVSPQNLFPERLRKEQNKSVYYTHGIHQRVGKIQMV